MSDTESYFNQKIKQAVNSGNIDKALKLLDEASWRGRAGVESKGDDQTSVLRLTQFDYGSEAIVSSKSYPVLPLANPVQCFPRSVPCPPYPIGNSSLCLRWKQTLPEDVENFRGKGTGR